MKNTLPWLSNARWGLMLGLLLSMACVKPVSWVGVPSGESTLCERLTVKADGIWSQQQGGPERPHHRVWTAEGMPLDQLHFYVAVPPGESLGAQPNRARPQDLSTQRLPRFQAGMQPQEIVDLMQAMASADGSVFQQDKLAPITFAGYPGFRFEFTCIRKSDEVTLKGVGFGAVRNHQLFLVVYFAPRIYYFDKHLPQVEALVQSARITE